MVSFTSRLVIIVCVVVIIGLLAYLYVKHNQPTDSNTAQFIDVSTSGVAKILSDNIKGAGVFYRGVNDVLIYRDQDNTYYNAGHCSDCPSACENSIYVQAVNKFYACPDLPPESKNLCSDVDKNNPNKFVSVQMMSADQYTQQLITNAGSNTLNTNDCVNLVNEIPGQHTDLSNELALAAAQKAMDSGFTTLWDYLKSRKDQILQLGGGVIEFTLLSKLIGEYAIFVMMAPMLTTPQGRYTFTVQSGYFISSRFWNKAINGSLKNALESMGTEAEDRLANLAGDNIAEYGVRLGTDIAERALTRVAAESTIMAIEFASSLLDPAFWAIDMLMLVGMILDAIDPCGLENSLSEDDLANISTSYNNLFFNEALQIYNKFPVEWFAEYVPEYGLNCALIKVQKDKEEERDRSRGEDKGSLLISESGLDMLTREENRFIHIDIEDGRESNEENTEGENENKGVKADDSCTDSKDPCCADNILKEQFQNEYFNALKVNSLGQCITPVTNEFLYEQLVNIFGVANVQPLPWPNANDILHASDFSKIIDYLGIRLANNNIVVANFIDTYWYFILALLICIVIALFTL